MKRTYQVSLTLLLSIGLFSSTTLSRKYQEYNCDQNCNYMCVLSDDLDCPVKCGCPPYQFHDHTPTKCEKYCQLFSEEQDCFKYCHSNGQNEQFIVKGLIDNEASQNIIQSLNNLKNTDELQTFTNSVNQIITDWSNNGDLLSQTIFDAQMSSQLSMIQTQDQPSQTFDFKCVATCTQNQSQDIILLKNCIQTTCLQSVLSLNQQTSQSLEQQTDEQAFMNFVVNALISLLVSGVFVFVIGFGGLKLFQIYSKKNEDLCDALLAHDYVKLNDPDNINSFNSSNYNNQYYNPPMGPYATNSSTLSPINPHKFNSYGGSANSSASAYNTPDPTQIQMINKQIKEAKNQYQSQNRSSNRLCLSGSYNKIDEDEDEHVYENEYEKKYE